MIDPGTLATPHQRARAADLLAPEEQRRWRRYRFARDRDLFLATRLLVRSVLANYTGVEARALRFSSNAHGKPSLVEGHSEVDVRFNLSNTRGLVVCAATMGREVGVDVEDIQEVPGLGAEYYLAPPELAELRAGSLADRRAEFYTFWTLKESFIKARGEGMSIGLSSFAVGIRPPRLLEYRDGAFHRSRWRLFAFAPTTHALALCIESREGERIEIVSRRTSAQELLDALRTCR